MLQLAVGPTGRDRLDLGPEFHAFHAVLVGVAEGRALPAAEGVIGDRHGDRDVDPDHADIDAGGEVAGRAVLIHTGWDRHWRTDDYFEEHPFLTEEAALFLKQSGVKLVGIDSYNIDDTRSKARPAHSILLGSEIPIVEHMTCLEQVPETGFQFFAVPPKVKAFGTFPVRCFAILEGGKNL